MLKLAKFAKKMTLIIENDASHYSDMSSITSVTTLLIPDNAHECITPFFNLKVSHLVDRTLTYENISNLVIENRNFMKLLQLYAQRDVMATYHVGHIFYLLPDLINGEDIMALVLQVNTTLPTCLAHNSCNFLI